MTEEEKQQQIEEVSTSIRSIVENIKQEIDKLNRDIESTFISIINKTDLQFSNKINYKIIDNWLLYLEEKTQNDFANPDCCQDIINISVPQGSRIYLEDTYNGNYYRCDDQGNTPKQFLKNYQIQLNKPGKTLINGREVIVNPKIWKQNNSHPSTSVACCMVRKCAIDNYADIVKYALKISLNENRKSNFTTVHVVKNLSDFKNNVSQQIAILRNYNNLYFSVMNFIFIKFKDEIKLIKNFDKFITENFR